MLDSDCYYIQQAHHDWKFPAGLHSPFCGEKPCRVGPTPGGAGSEFASFAPHSCQLDQLGGKKEL